MQITEFRAAQHRQVSADVIAALKEVGDRYGIDFKTSGGNIGQTSGMIKLEVELRDTAAGESRAKKMWDIYCGRYGLLPEHFGMIFVTGRGSYKITGINPSAPKYPVQAEQIGSGKSYKFPDWTVRSALPKKAA